MKKKDEFIEKHLANVKKMITKCEELSKSQSIEEAAEKYALKIRHYDQQDGIIGEPWESTVNHFIAGAKSQAAKEYWYEQFKREQI